MCTPLDFDSVENFTVKQYREELFGYMRFISQMYSVGGGDSESERLDKVYEAFKDALSDETVEHFINTNLPIPYAVNVLEQYLKDRE